MTRTFTVALEGGVLRRGFWIYVFEITPPEGGQLLYVGRTGDNSSPNAQSLFNRIAQNLGMLPNASMVRNNLESRGIDPAQCQFRVVGHGPIFDEVLNKDFEAHKPLRDEIGAVEKQLADDLEAVGYDVMNKVKWKPPLDPELYGPVRAAFAAEFPAL